MPSEEVIGDSHPSSDQLQLPPNERQVGFWKTDGLPINHGLNDSNAYTVGDSSFPRIDKHMSPDTRMLNHFGVPAIRNHNHDRIFHHISLDNNAAAPGATTLAHSLRRPLDNNNNNNIINNKGNRPNLDVNKLNVMGRHYENGLFSSSLSDLFTRKLRLSSNNNMYGHSVGDAAASHYEEEEPFVSLEEIEAQTIGNLLPDDDDLLSGMTDGIDYKVKPGSGDDAEELDFFSSVGGMELGEDSGQTQPGGEHPHPSRTLFVRNINSNVEDSELRILFEQYGDIRTLYTACKHRGFVMISYYDIRAARRAMQALQNKPLRHRKLDIHYSIPKDNSSDKDVNQGTVVIYNLDRNVTNDELRHIFGVYGEVKEIHEASQGSRHKSVEFYDIRAAEAALRELNKSDMGNEQTKLEPSHRSKRVFPELDVDETSALLQMCSPPTDFTRDISGPVSNVRVTPGTIDHRTLVGATISPATQLLDVELHRGIPASVSNSFSSIIGLESGGMPSGQQSQLKYDYRNTPNYHPHSLPEYQDGLTNSILGNSPSTMTASLNGRMPERVGTRQFDRISGSIGRSLELNDNVFGSSGNASGSPASHHYMWNPSHQPQHHNMMWPNSPSLMNGVGNAHSLPRAPSHMANNFLHINNHHVGSAPSVNHSVWDRRHSYAGESPDTSVFHPGSLGNMRVPSNSPHPLDFVSHNIFPRMGGNSMDLPIPSKNIGLASHHQNNVMFPSRGQLLPMMSSFDSPGDRARSRRNEGTSNQSDNKKQFELDLDRIMRGEDRRTTLMIKNIPNKYTSKMLLAAIDERHRGTYDFIYLPIDFKNKCNVGYAFINMTEPSLIVPFYQAFNGKKWEKFNSEKVASLAYARIQGKAALIAHFQNSSLMNEDKRCRPILFHTDGPNAGDQVPFPMGATVRSRVNKNRNNTNDESSQDVGNGEASSNGGDSSSGSTKDFE
uniref:protein MEI2-like 4 isoform X2 n=1 Tax=Erigeron canadensis TaxID=72917 RepID=UPI001CB97BA4|nr:protein MEI2-like 4 isoform X2 [Erigeron canadensis]